MKKKIQKYLAGEREGFSLVELIIVIAIMAILVGVVALAVLPNIEKSKESKDFATLDAVCSALNAAVASSQVNTSDTFELSECSSTSDDAVKKAVAVNLGSAQLSSTLTCTAAKDAKIYCSYDTSTGEIKTFAGTSTTAVVTSTYNGKMEVSSSSSSASAATATPK